MSHLIDDLGIFLLFPVIVALSGVLWAFHIVLGLVSGGPRAEDHPSRPQLYDRAYYLMSLAAFIGWAAGWLSIIAYIRSFEMADGFLLSWGAGIVAVSILYLTRYDMIVAANRYQATQGHFLPRMFYRRQADNMERAPEFLRKPMMVLSLLIGAGMLVYVLPHTGAALADIAAGARILAETLTTP